MPLLIPYAARPPVPLGPPTALWVVPVAEIGGVARHVLDATTHGIPGHRVVVACPPGPLADRLAASGVAVTTGDLGPRAGTARSVATVRRLLTTLRPAVVHSHLAHADVVTVAAATALPVAVVSTEHGIALDDAMYHRSRLDSDAMARVHRARLRRTDAVIAVSQATADAIRARWAPPQRLAIPVVHNGVDRDVDGLAHREGREGRDDTSARRPGLRIAALARFAPEKRLDDLVAAFAVLRRTHPDAHLTLAGEGPLRAAIVAKVADLGLTDAVDLPGHVDAAALLAQTDVVGQLSAWENCSYTLLDALAHGCGVVATAVGGNPEILPADALVPAGDHTQVASALARQGLDPASRPRLEPAWPTIDDMCVAIARVYAEVTR